MTALPAAIGSRHVNPDSIPAGSRDPPLPCSGHDHERRARLEPGASRVLRATSSEHDAPPLRAYRTPNGLISGGRYTCRPRYSPWGRSLSTRSRMVRPEVPVAGIASSASVARPEASRPLMHSPNVRGISMPCARSRPRQRSRCAPAGAGTRPRARGVADTHLAPRTVTQVQARGPDVLNVVIQRRRDFILLNPRPSGASTRSHPRLTALENGAGQSTAPRHNSVPEKQVTACARIVGCGAAFEATGACRRPGFLRAADHT